MQESEKAPRSWGGKREGAGRKGSAVKRYMLSAPEDVAAILEAVEGSKSAYIAEAVRFYAAHAPES